MMILDSGLLLWATLYKPSIYCNYMPQLETISVQKLQESTKME